VIMSLRLTISRVAADGNLEFKVAYGNFAAFPDRTALLAQGGAAFR